jgi:hypothetical protein
MLPLKGIPYLGHHLNGDRTESLGARERVHHAGARRPLDDSGSGVRSTVGGHCPVAAPSSRRSTLLPYVTSMRIMGIRMMVRLGLGQVQGDLDLTNAALPPVDFHNNKQNYPGTQVGECELGSYRISKQERKPNKLVAVGTVLTDGPPRRSQRAGLPHWAPVMGAWRRTALRAKSA